MPFRTAGETPTKSPNMSVADDIMQNHMGPQSTNYKNNQNKTYCQGFPPYVRGGIYLTHFVLFYLIYFFFLFNSQNK